MAAPEFLRKHFLKGGELWIFAISLLMLIGGCLQTGLDELEFFEVEINKKTWTGDYGTILLNGNISGLPNGELEDHGFIWSTDSEEINLEALIPGQTISRGVKSDADAFSEEFTFPNPNATYFFRAFAKRGDRLVFSENTDIVSLDYSLQILDATVSNNEIHLLGSVSGIENRGKFETYGYKFSPVESELDNGGATEFLLNDSLKLDGIIDSAVLENLDFNTTYFIRLFGKNSGKTFESETLTIAVKDGWRQLSGIGIPTIGAFGVSANGKGIVGFGCENDVFLTSEINRNLLTFDPADDSWTSTAPEIPFFLDFTLASKTVAFEIDNILYAGTGFGKETGASFHESRDFYSYDLTNNVGWTDIAEPLPNSALIRSSSVAFVLNGKAYVGGGVNDNGSNALNDFYEFDPTRATGEKWKLVEPMPLRRSADSDPTLDGAGREGAVAFTLNGKGYVGMGRNGGFFFYDFWEFDPEASPQWKFVNFFPGRSRSSGVSFTIGNDRAFIGTGFNPAVKDLNDLWEFDPTSSEWTERTPIPATKRSLAFGLGIGEKGYIGGGIGQKIAANGVDIVPVELGDFWEYIPAE